MYASDKKEITCKENSAFMNTNEATVVTDSEFLYNPNSPPNGLLCALNVALDNSSAVVPLKSADVGNVEMEREKRDGGNNKVGVKTGCTMCCVSLYNKWTCFELVYVNISAYYL